MICTEKILPFQVFLPHSSPPLSSFSILPPSLSLSPLLFVITINDLNTNLNHPNTLDHSFIWQPYYQQSSFLYLRYLLPWSKTLSSLILSIPLWPLSSAPTSYSFSLSSPSSCDYFLFYQRDTMVKQSSPSYIYLYVLFLSMYPLAETPFLGKSKFPPMLYLHPINRVWLKKKHNHLDWFHFKFKN